jgi:hypothetical protein
MKTKKPKKKSTLKNLGIVFAIIIILGIIGSTMDEPDSNVESENYTSQTETLNSSSEEASSSESVSDDQVSQAETSNTQAEPSNTNTTTLQSSFEGYKLIVVDGGNLSGNRQSKVVVDIGFGDREYWAFTNEYGQLVRVIADEIILQDSNTEPVNSNGRYYNDEAKVPGVESDTLDEGHVIADALGGVSNAYNITPQDSVLNRYGDQAYMEKNIRDAGGATNFEAIITYPDTNTQIPSHYHYTYTLKGNVITEDFDNVNPDEVNKPIIENEAKKDTPPVQEAPVTNTSNDISAIDTNGNGKVTIQEAKNAGFKMPITKE